jgi:hypothetical protein
MMMLPSTDKRSNLTILATEFKGKPAKPDDFFDATFVRELDHSGFTDALYKKR